MNDQWMDGCLNPQPNNNMMVNMTPRINFILFHTIAQISKRSQYSEIINN